MPKYLWKLNFWPPILASYINPSLEKVRTANPSLYSAEALVSSVINAALVDAPNSKLPLVNLSKSFLSLKKIIWLKAWPLNWSPIDNWVTVVCPINLSFSKTLPFPLAHLLFQFLLSQYLENIISSCFFKIRF